MKSYFDNLGDQIRPSPASYAQILDLVYQGDIGKPFSSASGCMSPELVLSACRSI